MTWWILGTTAAFVVFLIVSGAQWRTTKADVDAIVDREFPETVPPAACVLCERKPPQVGLVYDIGFWWCADYAECKRHRDERAEVAG